MLTLNGRQYEEKEITFGFIRRIDRGRFRLADLQDHPMDFIAVYVGECMGVSDDEAEREIDAHLASGGNMEEIVKVFADASARSGFFRARQEGGEPPISESVEERTM